MSVTAERLAAGGQPSMQQLLQMQWDPPSPAHLRRPRDGPSTWRQPDYREHDRLYSVHVRPQLGHTHSHSQQFIEWPQHILYHSSSQPLYSTGGSFYRPSPEALPPAGMPPSVAQRAEIVAPRQKQKALHASLGSTRRGIEPELPHPLWQDKSLPTHSSRQFRPREQDGLVYRTHLHPPLRPYEASFVDPRSVRLEAQKKQQQAAVSEYSASQPKRYHHPVKAALPALNNATYRKYLATTQPLLHPSITGRVMCTDNKWREELLQRKVDPYAKDVRA